MTFVERRLRSRNLPEGPAPLPDPASREEGTRLAEEFRRSLQRHPGLAHSRLLSLGPELRPGGKGGDFVGALRPLWHLDPGLGGAPDPADLAAGPAPEVRAGLADLDVAQLDDTWERFCEGVCDEPPPLEPCHSVKILHRVREELAGCGNFWVEAGALGLGLPLAWVLLARSLERAMEHSPREFAPDLRSRVGEEGERERATLNHNLGVLGPFLHEPEIDQAVRMGAVRFLDGWQVMLNGIDHRLYGGLLQL